MNSAESEKNYETLPDSNGSARIAGLKPTTLIRHGAAIGLFWWSGHSLANWYLYWTQSDYRWFAVSLLTGLMIAGGPWLMSLLKRTSRSRLLLVLLLFFLLLPWGEWLRLNTPGSREDWSRQLYHQTLFLYGVISALRLFPKLQQTLLTSTFRLLERLSSVKRVGLAFPVVFFLYSAWIGAILYGKTPIVQDSAAQLFQAKIFLQGFLAAPAPPIPDAFSFKGAFLAIYNGHWFCMYQPGLSMLLVPFLWIHSEWLACPLMGALTLAVWMDYIRRWHSDPLAVAFGMLFLFSPFASMMSSTVMIHNPELFIASVMIYTCRRVIESPSPLFRISLFVLPILMMLVRGFSMLPFLAPVLAYTFRHEAKKRKWRTSSLIVSGVILGTALLALYHFKTTGSPWIPPYRIVHPDYRYGFGPTLEGQIHTPARGLENTSNHLLGLNSWLTGFYSGSVFFLLTLIALHREFTRWDHLLLLCCLCLAVFYFGFVVQDLAFGPRYFYVLTPILLLFIVRNFDLDWKSSDSNPGVIAAVLIVSFLSFLPVRMPYFLKRYNPTDNQSRILAAELEKVKAQKVIVFLDNNRNVINRNDPFLKSNLIFCRDLGGRNAAVLAAFPGYQAAYFRQVVSEDFQEIRFRITADRGHENSGTVNFFSMAMTIQAAGKYHDKDLFDIGYGIMFPGSESALQLQYLKEKERNFRSDRDYQYKFGLGLIRIGELILLPKCALLEHGKEWPQALDKQEFRDQYKTSMTLLAESGEVGKLILQELQKAGRRIDRNGDGFLSDPEIDQFFNEKFRFYRNQ